MTLEMAELSNAQTTTSPREVVERVHRLTLDDDISAQADLYAPNGILEWPFAPLGVPRRMQGRDRIRRELMALEQRVRQVGTRLKGFQSVMVHETTDPEVIIAELDVITELAVAGIICRLPYIQVFRVRHGEIVLCRDYFTRVEVGDVPVLGF